MKDHTKTKKQLTEELEVLRKQIEARQNSEELYRLLAENTHDMITRHLPDSTYLYVSPACRTLFGYEPEELIGTKAFDQMHPEDVKKVIAITQEAVRTGGSQMGQYRHLRKDGQYIWVETVGKVMKNEETGAIEDIICVVRDITERKRAEDAILETKRDWENIFQAIGHPTIILDTQHNILSANRATIKAAGAGSAEELIGRKCYEIFHNAGKPPKGCPLVKMLASAKFEESEMEVEAFGGVFLVSCTPVFDEQGDLQKIIHIATNITERKQAEEALRKSEVLLNSTQQLTKIGGWEWDVEKQTMFWTDESYRIHGFRPDEIAPGSQQHIDRSLECYDPKDRPVILAAFQLCAQQGEGYDLEFPFTTAEGRRIWIRTTARPVLKDGRIIKVIGNIMDITVRKRAEEAIQQQLSIINTYSGMIALTDMEGLVIYMNAGGARMAGYEHPSELIGIKHIHDFHPPEDLQLVMDVGIPFAIEHGTWTGESRVLKADGSSIPVEQTIFVISDENGQPRNFGTIMADITERKRAEELLQMSEERFRILFENIPLGTGVATLEGKALVCNEVLAKITGYTKDEFLNLNVRNLYQHPEDREPLLKQLQSNGYVKSYEVIFKRKNGTSFYANLTINVIDFDGENALLTVIEDITERKRAEEELKFRNVILSTQQEVSIDGILVVDESNTIISYNQRFIEIWGIPPKLVESKDDEPVLQYVATKPVDQEGFLARVKYLYEHRQETSRDEIALRDGRTFDRYSAPMFGIDGKYYGRVWYFRDVSERKQAEEALRKEKTFSETMINSLPGIFYLFDENGYFLRWNRNFEIVSGYSSEEMGKMNPLDFFSGDEKKLVGEAIQKVFTKGDSNVEANFISKDGEKTPYYLTGLRFISDNRPYLVGMGIDITERKRVEEALHDSEGKYRLIADHADDWIYWVAPDGNLRYISPSCERVTGYSVAEFINHPQLIKKIVHPEDRETLECHYVKVQEENKPDYLEYRIITKTGEVRWISHSCSPIYTQEGQFAGRRGTNRNITARKRAEDEIRKLNAELEQRVIERTAQLEASNIELGNEITERKQKEEKIKRQNILLEGINWIVREALTVETEEDLSSQCLAIAEELTGSRFGFIDELNEAGTMDNLVFSDSGWSTSGMQYTDAGIFVKNIPVRGIYADIIEKGISVIVNDPGSHPDRVGLPEGHPPITAFLGVPLKQGERVIGLIGLANKESGYNAEDQQNIEMISIAFIEALTRIRSENIIKNLNKELKQSIDKVSHANKELEAFSYSVSHDLRAPLRAIDGFTEILLREYSPKFDDEGKRICSIITGNSKKMGQLIDELLSLSRLGRAEMHFSSIDMNDLANTVYDELTTPEMRQRIDFQLGDLCNVSGDPALIRQVWMNLISNAIKFSSRRERAVISITCKKEKDQIVHCIRDNGAGFNMQYASKLFEVFQRLHSEKEFEGTGVGLAIVQRIVHRHGGRIWAEGEIDKGAAFFFSLPK